MVRLLILVLLAFAVASPAAADDSSKCNGKLFVLWGDGRHDDTIALNAWFRGDPVVWGDNGRTVGVQIDRRIFRLTSPVYIRSGTQRRITNFKFVWPRRNEIVAGGTIAASGDPDRPPVATGLTKIGASPNEGVPYQDKAAKPAKPDRTGCLIS
jgi:hypothetical protein